MMICHAYHLSVFLLLSVDAYFHRNFVFVRAKETCSDPPPKSHTIPDDSAMVHEEDSRYRYKCIDGYLRKAGTSSLIWCKRNNNLLQWHNVNGSKALVCIPSPRMVHAGPTTIPATSIAPTTTPPTTASKTTLTTTTAPTTITPPTTTARTTTTAPKTTPTATTAPTTTAPLSTILVLNWKSTVSQSSISPLPSKTTKIYYRPESPFTDMTTNVKLYTPEPTLGPGSPSDTTESKNGLNNLQNTSPNTAVQSTFISSGVIAVIVVIALVLLLWRRRRGRIIEQVIMPEMLILMNMTQRNQLEDEN